MKEIITGKIYVVISYITPNRFLRLDGDDIRFRRTPKSKQLSFSKLLNHFGEGTKVKITIEGIKQ